MKKRLRRLLSTGLIMGAIVISNSTIAHAEWIQINNGPERGNWKYRIEGTEQYITGDFIDTNGDIYKFDSRGIMLSNYQDSYGRYYGTDGRLTNYLDYTYTNMQSQSEEFLKRQDIRFNSHADAERWKHYYDYCVSDYGNLKVMLQYKDGIFTLDSGTYTCTKSPFVDTVVTELAKNIRADTIEQTILNACTVASDYLEYDVSCVTMDGVSFDDVCRTRRAVCLGYARLTKELLLKAGIDTQMVYGFADNGLGFSSHCWLRTDLNQWNILEPGQQMTKKWVYTDPTWYDGARDGKYINIDYTEYLNRYKMKGV